MIQVNLIPDLKAEYLRAQRTKRIFVSLSFIVSAAAAGVVVLMFLYVNVAQGKHTNDLKGDIAELGEEYQSIQDLDKVLTVQKQLESLPGLHENKPRISRLSSFLSTVTPSGIVTLNSFKLDFNDTTFTLSGAAQDVPSVNVFVDSLKNARYVIADEAGQEQESNQAFTGVTLRSVSNTTDGTTFEVSLVFEPRIFTSSQSVSLTVNKGTSTVSETERPTVLFDAPSREEEE